MSTPVLPFVVLLALFATVPATTPQERGGGGDIEDSPHEKPATRGAKDKVKNKDKEEEDLAKVYFEIADYDSNGWIGYSEASKSLHVDRTAFAVYDQDRDGRISREEFANRYRQITSRGGAFAAPARKLDAKRPARRTPGELLDEFDEDRDKALSVIEVGKALDAYGARELDARTVVEKIDRNGSKSVEKSELIELVEVLSPSRAEKKRVTATSIEDLFGRKEPLEDRADKTLGPPRIQGPVAPFERLDFDQDGRISLHDLVELQRPIQVSIRVNAVVATLDRDGDGFISRAELLDSMTSR